MLVLNKKRIIFIILMVMISFVSVAIKEPYGESLLTSSTPVSNHTIILDAGHGLPDGGAVSGSGVSEEEINLNIVLKIQELLEESGSTVILTRSDENGIYDLDKDSIRSKKVSDLKNRVEIANNEKAEIFVSIHLNKIEQTNYQGWQAFYQSSNEDSKKLANYIQNNLNDAIQKENKRKIMKLSGKYLMDNVNLPMVTVECGFLSNEDESVKLQTDEYQQKIAWGIYTGIIDYFYE